jgi:tRNA-dihydrouridine synthase B
MIQIGPYAIAAPALLAPMAGVTDRPFRQLCRRLGAGLAASEMLSSNPQLRDTLKSRRRRDHTGEPAPRSVQIAGNDPRQVADFARYNVDHGAQIIDINMGCPAKKVCNAAAGSALLCDEPLVARILEAVVAAVPVPVTLKIRTGWSAVHRNGVTIARLAEAAGIQALAVHGRTRADAFTGHAEYDTIRDIKAAVRIPVIANGDITTPQQARAVLQYTGADAVMIGRGAQGNPWLFREITHYLPQGKLPLPPSREEIGDTLVDHLICLHDFYGEFEGVRIARKHLGWYIKTLPGAAVFWQVVNRVESAAQQIDLVRGYFMRISGELAA